MLPGRWLKQERKKEEGGRQVHHQHSPAMSLCALHNPYGISKDDQMGISVSSVNHRQLLWTAAQSTALDTVRSQDNTKHLSVR